MFTFCFFYCLSAHELRWDLSVGFDLLGEAAPFQAVFSVYSCLPPRLGIAFAFSLFVFQHVHWEFQHHVHVPDQVEHFPQSSSFIHVSGGLGILSSLSAAEEAFLPVPFCKSGYGPLVPSVLFFSSLVRFLLRINIACWPFSFWLSTKAISFLYPNNFHQGSH